MRITIEIDGIDVIKAEKQVIKTQLAPSVTEEIQELASDVPPPELLKAAANLGAENAGPAPAMLMEPDLHGLPIPSTFGDMPEEEIDSVNAGAAPNVSPKEKC